jgi:hypothetical protein
MGTKMENPKSQVQKVRISEDLRERCLSAKSRGAHRGESESTFYGYLVELGIMRYERKILPIEEGQDDVEEIKEAGAADHHYPGFNVNKQESAM